jgi:hypothetical protein
VVTDLADCVLDIDIAFLRNKAAIFYGHEVEVVVYLAVHNEKGLNDWDILLVDVVNHRLAGALKSVVHLLLQDCKRVKHDV